MKKKLLMLGAFGLISTAAMAFNGSVEIGYEHDLHVTGDQTYSRGDAFSPYIGLDLRPFEGNKLRIEAKYMYQNEYNVKKDHRDTHQDKKNRDRYELFFSGYQYSNGNFTFSPKVGFRLEQWDTIHANKDSSNRLNNQNVEMMNYRFYPAMTYNLNKQTRLYVSGHTGPVTFKSVGKDRNSGKSDTNVVKDRMYTNNWLTEMELLGVQYSIPGTKHMIGTSMYYEYKYTQYDNKYDRYQARLFGRYTINDKLTVSPYVRYDLDYDQKNLDNRTARQSDTQKRDRKALRLGTTFAYRVNPAMTVGGEVFWNNEKQHSWTSSEFEDRAKWFHKLFVRHTF